MPLLDNDDSDEWDDFDAARQGSGLAGLLRFRPKDACLRELAGKILSRTYQEQGNEETAIRGVLLGLEGTELGSLKPLVKRWVRYSKDHDEDAPPFETVAELALRVLGA